MKKIIYAIKINEILTEGLRVLKVKIGQTNNLDATLRQYKRTSSDPVTLDSWEVSPFINYRKCEMGVHTIAEKYALKRNRETFIFLENTYNDFSNVISMLLIKRGVKQSEEKIKTISGKKPVKFLLKNKEYEVKSWKDLLLKILEVLANENNNEFSKKIVKINYIKRNKNELRRPEKIQNSDYYIETNLSSNTIYKIIIDALKLFGYSENDLNIQYK